MDEVSLLKKKLERERAARKQAESILESKARELFSVNESLKALNQGLELEIAKRTKSLKESESRYRALVEQAKDFIYNIDKDGYFMYVNSIGVEIFGYEEKDIIGKRYINFMPAEDVQAEFEYYTRFRNEGIESDYHEFRVMSISGDVYWLGQNVSRVASEDGSYYYTAVARDITKRKEAEKELAMAKYALAKSEVKYRSIIENMDLGLMEVDTNGMIVKVYERFLKMLDYQPGDLVGKQANETLLVEGYETVLQQQDANRIKGESGVYEVKLRKKNGSEIWVIISGAPFYDENGEVGGSIGVHYDISDRKELEKQLEAARRKAVKAQKAEKAFLANMSHEIRTPLNAIIGMSHLLMDTRLDKEQTDFLDVLSSSANILKSLISDILDISKIDAGSLEVQTKPFDLRRNIEQLVSTFSLQNTDKDVVFSAEIDQEIDSFLVSDPQLLNQILLNLLSNAQKFTEEGKVTLQISIEEDRSDSVILIFEVIDTGIGISEADVLTIFSEFRQANAEIRSKYGGTGLGLSISNQLVKLLGGELKVESSIGDGARFYFSLDLGKTDQEVDLVDSVTEMELISRADHKILIVEDNKMNLKYITSLLKKWKLSYDVCFNGQEACDCTTEFKYDLVFMDLQMPIMDGYEATQVIRSRSNQNQYVPIVALTASTFLSKKRLALKAGMSDFLSKPFTPSQLSEMISKFLSRDVSPSHDQTKYEFSSVLDSVYLDEAYGGDSAYAIDMFETFLEIIDDELVVIRDALDGGDLGDIKSKLHRIKPTFTMVGLRTISEKIERVELKVAKNEHGDLHSWYQDIEKQIKDHIPVLRNEVEKMQRWQSD